MLRRAARPQPGIVLVDGRPGAGKTTFAWELVARRPAATAAVVHLDAYSRFGQGGPTMLDVDAVDGAVLRPLAAGRPVELQVAPREVRPAAPALVVLEGTFAFELAERCPGGLRVWVDAAEAALAARLEARGYSADAYPGAFIDAAAAYSAAARGRGDIVVAGDPSTAGAS